MSHSRLSCCLLLTLAPGEPFLDLSYEQALVRSMDEGKLLVADFTATWCPPCKKMEKDTWPAESVRAWLAEHALAIQIDVDEQSELAQTLKIEALPTIVAFKGGEEFDRIVGYRGPDELIAWLDGVRAGKRAFDGTRNSAASASRNDQILSRYAAATELLQNGDHDGALREFMWLWRNTPDIVRISKLPEDIERLCRAYEPAREAFLEILDATDVQVTKGGATEYVLWAEWFALSGALEQDRRIIAYYEQQRDEDGRMNLRHLGQSLDVYVNDEIFKILMDDGRIADAARLVADLQAKARQELAKSQLGRAYDERKFARHESTLVSIGELRQQYLQTKLSSLHAAALAVDQEATATAIAHLLLKEYDDAASRRALVGRAIQAGRVGPEHVRWLDEAEDLGAEVGDLREQLSATAPGH